MSTAAGFPHAGVSRYRRGAGALIDRVRVQCESSPLASLAPSQSYQWFSPIVVLSKRQHCWWWERGAAERDLNIRDM